MMSSIIFLVFTITSILLITCDAQITHIYPSTTVPPVQTPQYRFHYYVKDEKTGDYKAQEEHRTGDSVTGTYVVGEPNGDLRVVNYVADVSKGFKADVSVQEGASPVKGTIVANMPKDGIAPFNNYRTGISAPQRNRNKPARGFNPIVVKRLTPQLATALLLEQTVPNTPATHPYPYFKDTANASSFIYPTTQMAKKSVKVDSTFGGDSGLQKSGDVSLLQQRKEDAAAPTTDRDILQAATSNVPQVEQVSQSGLQQLANMAIPSSIMEIMNQHKGKVEALSRIGDTTTVSSTVPIYASAIHPDQENVSRIDSGNALQETDPSMEPSVVQNAKKVSLPQRPMRLIGLSPIYMEISQLQSITENLTTVPQIQLEPFTNMQYATPTPFQSGPLPGGPVGPFRNLPRAVSETNPELPVINTIPIANSIPISAPIIPQPFSNDFKGDVKSDNKTPSPTNLPLCADCFLPTNYGPYPLVKMPIPVSLPNNQKAPCPPPSPNNAPYWAPYAPSLAYILMPTQILKSKFNETRF